MPTVQIPTPKMKTAACGLFLAFAGLCGAATSNPEDLAQPVQIASNTVPNLDLKSSISVFTRPAVRFNTSETRHDRIINRVWIASLLSVAGSTSMDAATSWGKREGNSFLASSNGTFGTRGVSIKAGMLAAVVVPQVIFRNHRDLKSKFAIGNFAEAGIFTGVSIHNLGVTAPR